LTVLYMLSSGLVDMFQRGFGGADEVPRVERLSTDEPWPGVEKIE
jgi:hypothetical protein